MKFDNLINSILNETAKGKGKLVKDRVTGKMYNPDKEFKEFMNKPETLAMLKRMKNEEGIGWPKREK
jgi:hypothetical protein